MATTDASEKASRFACPRFCMPEWFISKVAGTNSLTTQDGGSNPSAGVNIESHGLAATSLANREGASVRGITDYAFGDEAGYVRIYITFPENFDVRTIPEECIEVHFAQRSLQLFAHFLPNSKDNSPEGANEDVPEAEDTAASTTANAGEDESVKNEGGTVFVLKLAPLFSEIDPDQSKVRISKNKNQITCVLHKVHPSTTWRRVVLDSSDPTADAM